MKCSKKTFFKQNVGPEDVFFGASDIDPSSVKCQELLLKVKLPGTFLAEIVTDIEGDKFWLQTPIYSLIYYIPYQIEKKNVKVKWVKDLEELHVIMKMVNRSLF